MNEFHLSVEMIWRFAGPAIGLSAIRACVDCGLPIEAVTANRTICTPCRRRRIQQAVRRCADCGRECQGVRCRSCRTAYVRNNMAAPEPRRSIAPEPQVGTCVDCGAPHSRRADRCATCAVEWNRVRNRNIYRYRQGLPVDPDVEPMLARWAISYGHAHVSAPH